MRDVRAGGDHGVRAWIPFPLVPLVPLVVGVARSATFIGIKNTAMMVVADSLALLRVLTRGARRATPERSC